MTGLVILLHVSNVSVPLTSIRHL